MKFITPALLGIALSLLGASVIASDAAPREPERWLVELVIACPLGAPLSPDLCKSVHAVTATWDNTAATKELCQLLAMKIAAHMARSMGLSAPYDYYVGCADRRAKANSPGNGGQGPMLFA